MTPAEIAADVAARYGVQCRPEAVRIIPRGVSGLPDPSEPKGHWSLHFAARRNIAHKTAARVRRLRKAKVN